MPRFRPRSAAFLDRLPSRNYVSERADIVTGGISAMIANCPTCGTHFKHEPPTQSVRARCGQCAATLDLANLRPYRITPAVAPSHVDVLRAARHSAIGLDHPALATVIAQNVSRPQQVDVAEPAPDLWEDQDPLPPIPEMALREPFGSRESDGPGDGTVAETAVGSAEESTEEDGVVAGTQPGNGQATTLGLWVAAGAIAGTGASWTMGGTTMPGLSAGAALGAAAGWGWLRWTSPR